MRYYVIDSGDGSLYPWHVVAAEDLTEALAPFSRGACRFDSENVRQANAYHDDLIDRVDAGELNPA